MRTLFVWMTLLVAGAAYSQSAIFTVSVSNDSILLGNRFSVSFTLKNAQGEDFFFPDFEGVMKVSGPHVSTQMNFVNGKMSQQAVYTFQLEAHEVGEFYIAPASVKVGEDYLETLPLPLRVYPNPEGIIQHEFTPRDDMSPFGQWNFGMDFFDSSPFGDPDFFGQGLPDTRSLWKEFFGDTPWMLEMPQAPAPDSTAVQPKKRKTTKI
ncbi:MAG: BatD family protein [Saprospiraceae bacterium]